MAPAASRRSEHHMHACIASPCPRPSHLRPAEYIEVMKDKELVLRTDVFEVLLEQLEAQQDGEAAAAAGGDAAAAGAATAGG